MTAETNQQGAPEALRLADALQAVEEGWSIADKCCAELRRLHAENERLVALVEAQQPAPSAAGAEPCPGCIPGGYCRTPKCGRLAALNAAPQPSPTPQADSAPSAAAPVGEVPLPLLVRDIAADLGTTPIQVCTALAQLGFGGHSVNMAVTPRMAKSLRAHFASTTTQADSQPALDQRQQLDAYYSLLDAMGWESKRQHISPETWAADLLRDATAYRAARAPEPIDMVLHCPKCGLQHIDAAEVGPKVGSHHCTRSSPDGCEECDAAEEAHREWLTEGPWLNPPHRSHLCHGCGHIWRPADVPTNGVKAVKTKGKADSPIAARAPADSVTAPAGEANWAQLRSALAMLMLGWGRNPNQTMDACYRVLDSATEPGTALAILRTAPDWRSFMAADRAKADSVQEDADPIRALIAEHAAILDQNESAYFELCYHRATGWMAWITDKPLCMPPVVNPDRKVLAQGQGDTADEACRDAARKQGGA